MHRISCQFGKINLIMRFLMQNKFSTSGGVDMTKKEKKRIIPSSTAKYIMRALLRMFPLIPGPELFDIITDFKKSRALSNEKIEKAYSSLQETYKLINELEENLNERTGKLIFLRSEYERYSKLAEVEEGNSRALIQQLELSLGKTRNRERWVSLLINLIAGIIIFMLGILLSPIIRT